MRLREHTTLYSMNHQQPFMVYVVHDSDGGILVFSTLTEAMKEAQEWMHEYNNDPSNSRYQLKQVTETYWCCLGHYWIFISECPVFHSKKELDAS